MSRSIAASTRLVAVFGDPIIQTRSPELHNEWIKELNLDAVYVALRLTAENPQAALQHLGALGFLGANVTLPHKEAALASAKHATPYATRIGAANTLRVLSDGTLEASNTDAPGFVAALTEAIPTWEPQSTNLVLLGAGGAARAIAVGLRDVGVHTITIVNRSLSRAETVAHLVSPARALGWDQLPNILPTATLIVNATSRGLKGVDPIMLDFTHVRRDAIIVDTVYNPLETVFLAQARRHGLKTVDGLGMLIHQAALSFEAWFGVRPDTVRARARLIGTL